MNKYTWVDIGSSYLPGELIAAFLWAQMESSAKITKKRIEIWKKYHQSLEILEKENYLRRPKILKDCKHNGHLYYLILNSEKIRNELIKSMDKFEISFVFHYIPLHSSPFYKKKYSSKDLPITTAMSKRIVRLPIWPEINEDQDFVLEKLIGFFS